jgi:hypothetical protein
MSDWGISELISCLAANDLVRQWFWMRDTHPHQPNSFLYEADFPAGQHVFFVLTTITFLPFRTHISMRSRIYSIIENTHTVLINTYFEHSRWQWTMWQYGRIVLCEWKSIVDCQISHVRGNDIECRFRGIEFIVCQYVVIQEQPVLPHVLISLYIH